MGAALRSILRCSGCGAALPPLRDAPLPFRCPRADAGDDVDHVLARVLDPEGEGQGALQSAGAGESPFVMYRGLLHSYQAAREAGLDEAGYVAVASRIDEAVARVEGHGLRPTPFGQSEALGEALGFRGVGGVWIKDETGNVAGSHKGRPLMGILLHLEIVEAMGLAAAATVRGPLAIASCGNAALAAAVLARAAGRELVVFIPPDADQEVVARLAALGARITICPREPGMSGDPCYLRFKEAIARGALPFSCQGPDNALAIQGGLTLGYEMVSVGPALDRILVQVGGGALASGCVQALSDAVLLGAIPRMPRVHAVQTLASPLSRAYDRVAARIAARIGARVDANAGRAALADAIREAPPGVVAEELRHAATHRSQFMWPWEVPPRSVAHGILDDETYDWLAVVQAMLATGGHPIVVGEEALIHGHALAQQATGVRVDPTGSSGLAGLVALAAERPEVLGERVAVLFTGRDRRAARSAADATRGGVEEPA